MLPGETRAQAAGRHDAQDWIAEREPHEWAAAIAPGVPAADQCLIEAMGTKNAARMLGVHEAFVDGALSTPAFNAFNEYAASWRAAVEDALVRRAAQRRAR